MPADEMVLSVVLPAELGGAADPAWVGEFARITEDLGFDEISVYEHALIITDTQTRYPYAASGRSPLADDCEVPDPLELLAFVAGRTTRLGLATGVLILPIHHPAVLAKRLATLDRLSDGRLRVGVGLGWDRDEITACGGDFDDRAESADDAIALMRALWADESSAGLTFRSGRYSVERAHSYPKPKRPGGPPIFIGGHTAAAARRAGRLGNGFQPLGLADDGLAGALAVMRAAAVEARRRPEDVEVMLGAGLSRFDGHALVALRAQGATRVLLAPSPRARSLDDVAGQLTACAARLGLR